MTRRWVSSITLFHLCPLISHKARTLLIGNTNLNIIITIITETVVIRSSHPSTIAPFPSIGPKSNTKSLLQHRHHLQFFGKPKHASVISQRYLPFLLTLFLSLPFLPPLAFTFNLGICFVPLHFHLFFHLVSVIFVKTLTSIVVLMICWLILNWTQGLA